MILGKVISSTLHGVNKNVFILFVTNVLFYLYETVTET